MINVKNELQYMLVLGLLEKLAGDGLLTDGELGTAKRLAVEKYRPQTVWESCWIIPN